MKTLMALFVAVFLSVMFFLAYAGNAHVEKEYRSTDSFCLMDCLKKGYTYGYCENFCSY